MKTDKVTATVEVAVDPQTAFKIFTEDIDAWWERGPANFYDGGRAVAMRFEPGVGGRYLEVYDDAKGDALEIGRITLWEPGKRFVWRSSLDDTEIDIRFEPIPAGTRVLLEQRLVDGGTKAHFYAGWKNILGWFAEGAERRGERPAKKDLPRISPLLYYRDLDAAAEWLVRVFDLQPRHRGHLPGLDELMLGDSMVMLRKLDTGSDGRPGTAHSVYAYVDDLDRHFARSEAGGAKIVQEIKKYGDRTYVVEDLEGHRWIFAQARPTHG